MNCTGSSEATFKIGKKVVDCCEIDLWHTLWSPDPEGGDVRDWSLEMVEELAIASGMAGGRIIALGEEQDPGFYGGAGEAREFDNVCHFGTDSVEFINDPKIEAALDLWREQDNMDDISGPSYFTVYDQTGHEGINGERMVVNAVGEPVLHDAERHEQECSLNAYANQWIGGPHTITWRDEFSLSNVECKIVATGEKFSVATSKFGAAFVPKSCGNYIGGVGETFWATLDTTFEKLRSGGAKYPLRVRAGSIY